MGPGLMRGVAPGNFGKGSLVGIFVGGGNESQHPLERKLLG